MARQKHEINMLSGPLYPNLIAYTIPLLLSGILQLLYNAADVIVVGRWGSSQSLAAVGSCGAVMNLMINLFLGLSVGTSVIVAQRLGAGKHDLVHRAVQTAVIVSAIGGVIIGLAGFALARTALVLMDNPPDVLDLATTYLRICMLGVPGIMVYNFGAAVLRAAGDTKRPLYFLAISGAVNVVLNLVFVIVFRMDVAGVALATIISQYMSAAMVVVCLINSHTCYRFDPRKFEVSGRDLLEMVRIGLPAGFQGTLFSISNVVIQSTINSFGSVAMAGSSASSNLEGFVYAAMNSLYHTALTFTGQNYGAKQYKRTKSILLRCQVLVVGVGVALGALLWVFHEPLLSIYAPGDEAVIASGAIRCQIIALTYFTCGIMDVMVGGLRGLGYSIMPMIVSLLGSCVLRIVWIYTVFPLQPTLFCLFLSYPVSWILTSLVHVICYLVVVRKLPKDGESPLAAAH